jgi:hypothetical protein
MNKSFHFEKKALMLVFLLMYLLGCKIEVGTDFTNFDPLPVVNSILEAGKPIRLNLSLAEKLDSVPLTTITDATIELFVDGIFAETLKNNNDGNYTSTTLIEPLKNYTCKVICTGKDTVTCSQTLPAPLEITHIEHINVAGANEEGCTYPAVLITFKNNQEKVCYYEAVIMLERFDRWDSTTYFQNAWLQTIEDPAILNEGLPIALFSNETMQDSTYTLKLNYFTGNSGRSDKHGWRTGFFPFRIHLRTVSYDYYRYKKQYYLYNEGKNNDGLLSSPTAFPLYSNIENGYGIFAGYSTFVSDSLNPKYDDER